MARNDGTNVLAQVALWLAVIGAVNWGLVGIADFDLVRAVLGGDPSTDASGAARVVYALVGLAGLGLAGASARLRGRERAPLQPTRTAEAH